MNVNISTNKGNYETSTSALVRTIKLLQNMNESFCFGKLDWDRIVDFEIYDFDYVDCLDCHIASSVVFVIDEESYKLRFYSQEVTKLD